MMEYLNTWARGLVSASVLAAIAQQIGARSHQKKVIDFICGVMMLAVLLSPVVHADRLAFSDALNSCRRTAAELTADVEEKEKQMLRAFIEQKCGAYILDEAEKMSIEGMDVKVRTKWIDEGWVPWEASIEGTVTPEQRGRLSSVIDSELGIPEERQHWNE